MKTITRISLLILSISLFSCQKEEDSVTTNCKCGSISSDGNTTDSFWIEVRNNCTSNKKKVYMDEDLWMNAHVGDKRCYDNEW